jgi:hypothetical protein
MAGQTLRLSQLAETFPGDRRSLTLAYEQSKSVVAFIDRQFGKQAILKILSALKNGKTLETASMQSLSITVNELENQWIADIERTPRWLVYLADNLYGILFFLAAVLTVCGFLLQLKRKRRWEDEQEEDEK